MALKDIIREAHSNEELASSLSQFIRERTAKEPARDDGWHPSQFAGMCPRLAVLDKLLGSSKKKEKIDAGQQRIFDVGHALHAWYQNNYFGKMGVLWGKWECRFCGGFHWGFLPSVCSACKRTHSMFTYKEVSLRARLEGCELPVVGHADGILNFGGKWLVLEIKTMNSYSHGALDEPYPSHYLQAQIYAELIRQGKVTGVPSEIKVPFPSGIVFLYICKNDSREKEFMIPIDEKAARLELQKPFIVEDAVSRHILPDRKPECVSLLKEPAKKCPRCSHCFGQKSFDELALFKN